MKTDARKDLWQLSFGDPEVFIEAFFANGYAPERCHSIAEDGQIVAALYWLDAEYDSQKIAYIYGVATHPAHRGKGLCRKLMTQTHDMLRQRGYMGALLVPAKENLRQMYEKMGYRDCTQVSEFSCDAGDAVPVKTVGIEEYARLRRQYLPEGGAVQEQENLRYLESYAELFAGEDFLLAAAAEEGTLMGIELLGNRDAAPGILKALGFPKGRFRVPGDELPFAMFYTLQEDFTPPDYFGLAFD